MARALDAVITSQQGQKNIDAQFTFTVDGIDYSNYMLDWSVSFNTEFGSATATFTLDNNQGVFGEGSLTPIEVGAIVSLKENYKGSTTNWNTFYGKVDQRNIVNSANSRTIQLTCLDYISVLKQWDIDLKCEGVKVEVRNEILQPNFLPSPNNMFAQVFNFANDAIAQNPLPLFTFRDKTKLSEDPQYDGLEVRYSTGQVKLGSPLQARDNYDLVSTSYYFYTEGIFCEDVLEQILTQINGYGGYLFGESSAANVIANHLTSTYYAEEDSQIDVLTPNLTSDTITLRHSLIKPTSVGDTSITLDSANGLPNSGQASINGDIFTWTDIESGNTLVGIPASGAYSLSSHPSGAKIKYSKEYPSGQVWYLKYSNLTTELTDSDFTIPGASLAYLDKRNGRIILDTNINLSSVVYTETNYTFKTLQTSGVELNWISFRPRELNNRYEAIEKLKKYLPPNYIIRTQGDTKIWASLMYQKTVADYDLTLTQQLNYMEDQDLYTRVVMYGKNNNPTNLMFDPNISFVTTGESYKAFASQSELLYEKTEDGYRNYLSSISNAGRILLDTFTPLVFINGVPVNNTLQSLAAQPIKIQLTTRTETTTSTGDGKEPQTTTETRTYYYYKIYFSHQNIEPSMPIYLYNLRGVLEYTISPYTKRMDYGRGIYTVPGSSQNSKVETLSTASYWVFYSSQNIVIDYDNVIFKISDTLIPDPLTAVVQASFEYYAIFTAASGTAALIDGRWDTQVQTEFYSEPPSGYEYAIIDFGSIKTIQAMDVIAGFYKPDEYRRFDIEFNCSLQYSLNGTDFYEISEKTHNLEMTGGGSISLEENDLGVDFQTRYLKIILEKVKKIDYGEVKDSKGKIIREGIWVVALTEAAAYADIILRSEAKLIPTTVLTNDITSGGTIDVTSTAGFTDPESGETATAYINNHAYNSFTYTGLTATSFLGVTLLSGCSGSTLDTVSQTVSSSTSMLDTDGLLAKMGDRLYKKMDLDQNLLFDQADLDRLSLAYLQEFYKNHSKISVDVLYAPYLKLGQTVNVTDDYNGIDNIRYFIEAISYKPLGYQVTLARYPG